MKEPGFLSPRQFKIVVSYDEEAQMWTATISERLDNGGTHMWFFDNILLPHVIRPTVAQWKIFLHTFGVQDEQIEVVDRAKNYGKKLITESTHAPETPRVGGDF